MSHIQIVIGLLIATAGAGGVAFWAMLRVRDSIALPVTARVGLTHRYTAVAFYSLILAFVTGATAVAVWA